MVFIVHQYTPAINSERTAKVRRNDIHTICPSPTRAHRVHSSELTCICDVQVELLCRWEEGMVSPSILLRRVFQEGFPKIMELANRYAFSLEKPLD